MFDLRKITLASSAPLQPLAPPPLFTRVVAGIDFGPASLAAARWAFAYVARDAHAILSHVAAAVDDAGPLSLEIVGDGARTGHNASHDGAHNAGHYSAPDDARDGSRAGANAFVQSVKRLAPALNGGLGGFAATLRVPSAHTVVRVGRPSHWLGAVASGAEAGLIVLGRRSNANRSRIGEPNVIERVTRRTNAAVLVVPEGVHDEPRYVVAAVDRSAVGREVIETATALSDLYGYQVVVLHVVPPSTGAYGRVVASERRARVEIRREGREIGESDAPDASSTRVPAWLKMMARHDRTAAQHQARVAIGDPAREIMAAARALGAAMVIVGKRGEDASPIGSVGSVARELLAAAPVPVLAVDAPPSPLSAW